MECFIPYKNSTVSFEIFGHGWEVLLAFHGYGKNASSLALLSRYWGHRYKIVSIDIFHHGKSYWNEDHVPTTAEWEEIITEITYYLHCHGKFSVLGYSIGGKPAVLTAYLFANRINTLFLVAATGFTRDKFYNFCVNTTFGRFLFRLFVKNGLFIRSLLKAAVTVKLLPQSLQSFIDRKIDTKEKRHELHKRWMVLRHFYVAPDDLAASLNHNNTNTVFIFGKSDPVVHYTSAIKFAKSLRYSRLELPDTGHQLIQDDVLKKIPV